MAPQDPESRYINATLLLYDTEEGERPAFLELIKVQHWEDCQHMQRQVLACIDHVLVETTDSDASSARAPSPALGPVPPALVHVPIGKMREAITLADANKSRTEVNQLLARGLGCTVETVLLREAKRVPLSSVEEFRTNICTGILKKSPPPAPKKAAKK